MYVTYANCSAFITNCTNLTFVTFPGQIFIFTKIFANRLQAIEVN